MKKRGCRIAGIFLFFMLSASWAGAHCEIPCGIYDDEMRIKLIAEHIATIEKSMKQVIMLQKKDPLDYNQIVRWITNKENHADQLQEIVTQYFMTQRIKPDTSDYMKKLGLLHQMLISAMKCKQTLDLSHTQDLTSLLKEFESLYFKRETH